jgi:hypothetical protein
MKSGVESAKETVRALVANRKLRTRTIAILGILFVVQVYFVRELLAAEILFAIGFLSLILLVGMVYALGAIGERGLDLTEAGVRVLAVSARRGYAVLEEMSRKALRPTHSGSAQ